MLLSYTWHAVEHIPSRLLWHLPKELSGGVVKPPPETFFTSLLLAKLALASLSPNCFGILMLPTSKGLRAVRKISM